MSVLIPIGISANYEEDNNILRELNQHLEIFYLKEDDEISFNFTIAKNDHYVTISIPLADLIEAIGRAIKLSDG